MNCIEPEKQEKGSKGVYDFEGDFTFVVFPILRYSKARPEETARVVGEALTEKCQFIDSSNKNHPQGAYWFCKWIWVEI